MRRTACAVLTLSVLSLLITMHSCDEKEVPVSQSSFDLIQSRIFNQSCAISGCHSSEKDATFLQHGLVLSKGKAYNNLVDVDSRQENARADGLKRVAPGHLEKSLLLRKVNCSLDGNFTYGNMMPLGKDALSAGQVEFIETWIKSGAPKDGTVCTNISLLDDNVSVCDEDFEGLAAPEQGKGYQIRVDPFEVQPQFEREIFLYKEVGNAEEFYLDRMEMRMRRNSHHFLVTTYDAATPASKIPGTDVIRDVRDENGRQIYATLEQMEYQIPTMASQTPVLNYEFPPGVALRIPANHKLDLNLHYVNKSTTTILGECSLNLYKADPGKVVHEARPIFLSHTDIHIGPKQKTVLVREFTAAEPMHVIMLTSHTHKLGERFEIQIKGGNRNGELIYASSEWHHPLIKRFDSPLEIKAGEGLRMIVTYDNPSDRTVKFGLTSDDEMAIIYGYYY